MIKALQWESDFFNLNIAEIDFSKSKSIENLTVELPYDLIIVKNKTNNLGIPGYTKTFEEVKVNFCKTLKSKHNSVQKTIRDTDIHPISPKELYNLAYLSGNFSRFKLDEKFTTSHFKKLYETWVHNSINKSYGYKVFYITHNDKPVAFVTLNKKDEFGQIGLIAVDASCQGQGLGKQLINHVEYFCTANGMISLTIPTQQSNSNAMAFYKKLGYSIAEELKIEHFWKNNK